MPASRFAGMSCATRSPVAAGHRARSVLGKPIGIFGAVVPAIALEARRQAGRRDLAELFGVGILGGIGFTMSLFIGMLAFAGPGRAAEIRIGVLARAPRLRARGLPRPSRRHAAAGALATSTLPSCEAMLRIDGSGKVHGRRVSRGFPWRLRASGLACRAAFMFDHAPLVILLRQLVPLDRQRPAGCRMLPVPIAQKVEACVVDVVELD